MITPRGCERVEDRVRNDTTRRRIADRRMGPARPGRVRQQVRQDHVTGDEHDRYHRQRPRARQQSAVSVHHAQSAQSEQEREVRLSRPVDPTCLSCHASRLQPIYATQNRYADPPFLLTPWDIVGVQNMYGRRAPGTMVAGTGNCLNIFMPYSPGRGVQMFECQRNAGNATWIWEHKDGTYYFYAPSLSAYLDVPNSSTDWETALDANRKAEQRSRYRRAPHVDRLGRPGDRLRSDADLQADRLQLSQCQPTLRRNVLGR